MGCVAFCRLRDGTKSGARISATLCFLKFAKMLKKMQKVKILKSYGMCRFLPPPGRQQNRTGNHRYLVFFEIRKNFEKDAKNKIIIGCVAFCRLWDGTKSGARISGTLCFLKFVNKLKKIKT